MRNVEFKLGVMDPSQIPEDPKPFILVAGRSNTGKSTLLNVLFSQKKLARVSKTPGRTREINFFLVDDSYYIVDLPGYGYARVSNDIRAKWERVIPALFDDERTALVLLLVDIRREIREDEEMVAALAISAGKQLKFVLTKKDKVGRNQAIKTLNLWKKDPRVVNEPCLTSALNREGFDELRKIINDAL